MLQSTTYPILKQSGFACTVQHVVASDEPISRARSCWGFIGSIQRAYVQWTEQLRGLLYLFANILGAFFAEYSLSNVYSLPKLAADDLISNG